MQLCAGMNHAVIPRMRAQRSRARAQSRVWSGALIAACVTRSMARDAHAFLSLSP